MMTRTYGKELQKLISREDDSRLGVELARVCVNANLPAIHVAGIFGVSRMTIHSWFRGGMIRMSYRPTIDRFMDQVEDDMGKERLPAESVAEAKSYLDRIRSTVNSGK
jgi:hypothetical protein